MPASIGINLRVTGHCRQGGRKYMEDFFSVAYQQTEDEKDLEYAFFGIYDGHGGAEAAAFAKEHLMDTIVKHKSFWSENDEDVLKAIKDGYIATHYAMWKEQDKWPKTAAGLPSTAGTTASVAFIRRGKIYIGHVGDSGIILGYQLPGSSEWKAKPLTKDHKPESQMEMSRIESCGGKVVAKSGVPRVVWNRPRIGHKGPVRRSTPIDEIPFLAVARSLGDLWSYNSQLDEFVVSPDPDCSVITIDSNTFRCLIFGTDGLYNMLCPQAAVSIVQSVERHNENITLSDLPTKGWLNPSKCLVERALERWSSTKMRADNTSVITIMLDPPGPPRAQVLKNKKKNLTESGLQILTRYDNHQQQQQQERGMQSPAGVPPILHTDPQKSSFTKYDPVAAAAAAAAATSPSFLSNIASTVNKVGTAPNLNNLHSRFTEIMQKTKSPEKSNSSSSSSSSSSELDSEPIVLINLNSNSETRPESELNAFSSSSSSSSTSSSSSSSLSAPDLNQVKNSSSFSSSELSKDGEKEEGNGGMNELMKSDYFSQKNFEQFERQFVPKLRQSTAFDTKTLQDELQHNNENQNTDTNKKEENIGYNNDGKAVKLPKPIIVTPIPLPFPPSSASSSSAALRASLLNNLSNSSSKSLNSSSSSSSASSDRVMICCSSKSSSPINSSDENIQINEISSSSSDVFESFDKEDLTGRTIKTTPKSSSSKTHRVMVEPKMHLRPTIINMHNKPARFNKNCVVPPSMIPKHITKTNLDIPYFPDKEKQQQQQQQQNNENASKDDEKDQEEMEDEDEEEDLEEGDEENLEQKPKKEEENENLTTTKDKEDQKSNVNNCKKDNKDKEEPKRRVLKPRNVQQQQQQQPQKISLPPPKKGIKGNKNKANESKKLITRSASLKKLEKSLTMPAPMLMERSQRASRANKLALILQEVKAKTRVTKKPPVANNNNNNKPVAIISRGKRGGHLKRLQPKSAPEKLLNNNKKQTKAKKSILNNNNKSKKSIQKVPAVKNTKTKQGTINKKQENTTPRRKSSSSSLSSSSSTSTSSATVQLKVVQVKLNLQGGKEEESTKNLQKTNNSNFNLRNRKKNIVENMLKNKQSKTVKKVLENKGIKEKSKKTNNNNNNSQGTKRKIKEVVEKISSPEISSKKGPVIIKNKNSKKNVTQVQSKKTPLPLIKRSSSRSSLNSSSVSKKKRRKRGQTRLTK